MEKAHERLRFARKQFGLDTPTEAANRFGWNRSTYSGHENGSTPLSERAMAKYAKAFKVSFHWLKTGEGSPDDPSDLDLIEMFRSVAPRHKRAVFAFLRDVLEEDEPET